MPSLFDVNPPRSGPGGYGPPNMAEQLYNMIGGLPAAYQEGVKAKFERGQMARTERLQAPYTGPMTAEAIQQTIAQHEGVEGLKQFLTQIYGAEANRLADRVAGGGGYTGGAGGAPAPATDHQTPEKLRGEQPPSAASVGAASQADQADDTAGPWTLKALVERSGFTDNPMRTANMLGAQLHINPNTMLTREQAGQVSAALENQFGERPGAPEAPQAMGSPPASSPPAYFQGGATPGAQPVPTQTVRPPGMAQGSPGAAPGAAPGGSYAPPTPFGDIAEAQRQEAIAQRARKAMGIFNLPKNRVEELKATAEAAEAKAKAIREGSAGINKEYVVKDMEAGQKQLGNLQNVAEGARDANAQLALTRTEMSNPNFYSGPQDELMKRYKQWISVLPGGDPNAAKPMEEFRKNMYDMLGRRIAAMTAAGYSRIQIAEIKNLQNAMANLSNTPATNRYLVEEVRRLNENQVGLHDEAQKYLQSHQYLDARGWGAVRDHYLATHKLFTDREIADPRLIAPAYLPASIENDAGKRKQWARNQGLQKGDPYMVDGPDPRLPEGPNNRTHLRAWPG